MAVPQLHVETSLEFTRSPRGTVKQPLYRPAALRRNASPSTISLPSAGPSPLTPPISPNLSSEPFVWTPNGTTRASRIWSTVSPYLPTAGHETSAARYGIFENVKGVMVPRSSWQPDESVLECEDRDCNLRFTLTNRKHHCRQCGHIFCANHSSRSSLLWPSNESPTKMSTSASPEAGGPATPRSTNSSQLDLPSLTGYFNQSHSRSQTSPGASPAATPGGAAAGALPGAPLVVRVCDNCFFFSPTTGQGRLATPAMTPTSSPPLSQRNSFSRSASLHRTGETSPSMAKLRQPRSASVAPAFQSGQRTPPQRRRREISTSSSSSSTCVSVCDSPPERPIASPSQPIAPVFASNLTRTRQHSTTSSISSITNVTAPSESGRTTPPTSNEATPVLGPTTRKGRPTSTMLPSPPAEWHAHYEGEEDEDVEPFMGEQLHGGAHSDKGPQHQGEAAFGSVAGPTQWTWQSWATF